MNRRRLFFMLLPVVFCLGSAAQAADPRLANIGIDQNLNAALPGDLHFNDETGADVRLGDYFSKRPVVLALVYFRCQTLCSLTISDLIRSMTVMPPDFSAGGKYDVLVVSFDPTDKPSEAVKRKMDFLREYERVGSRPDASGGVHFLTGSQASITALTGAVGFHYASDKQSDPKDDQFAHPSGIIIVTPEGKISRYFFGIDYAPRDLRLSLIEADNNKIGSLTDTILLFCLHYDPSTSKYTLAIGNLLKVAAALTVVILGSFIGLSLRREKKKAAGDFQT